jgi:MoxR-like ATPase
MIDRVRIFRDNFTRVQDEISKVIVGQQDILEGILTCLFANGHVLLEGLPGLGRR